MVSHCGKKWLSLLIPYCVFFKLALIDETETNNWVDEANRWVDAKLLRTKKQDKGAEKQDKDGEKEKMCPEMNSFEDTSSDDSIEEKEAYNSFEYTGSDDDFIDEKEA